MKTFDFIIIGGGVIGCTIARSLSRYKLSILLVEKESDIGMVTSSANSALVHAGYDAVAGSLKAKMNVAASPMWDTFAGELNIPFRRCGDFVVAVDEKEVQKLEELLTRGKKNGVPGLKIVTGDELKAKEPLVNPNATAALWAPTGGICDPFAATLAAGENAVMNGVQIALNTTFESFITENGRIIGVHTNRGDFSGRWVVNAAGLQSDAVMHKAGVRPEFKITPRRGEYFIVDREEMKINSVLFPVPSDVSKGILVTATMHENTLIGPNAQNIDDKEDKSITAKGMDEIWNGAKKLVPSVNQRSIIASYAGLRAGGNAPCADSSVDYTGDFVIEIPETVMGLVNLGGIESPGLSAAPAIGQYVVELLKDHGEQLIEKADYQPIRPARPRFRHMSMDERKEMIQRDARYGRVICRCEMVTEGEIVAEIHSPIPATTYDAIKRRTWLGTGRCQGGFDMPLVVEILARELGKSPLEITKKGEGSEYLYRKTKTVEGQPA
ncbi:MAG: NAD(P)/FAD-dependent oxidoreductase [Anaerolineae bacterium]|nr:NAD(P)/FAD-dependent oxidoreductase [Anaerolineae bacterium]